MRSNLPFHAFWVLVLAFGAVAGGRWLTGDLRPEALQHRLEFAYTQTIQVDSAPGAFHLGMYLPRANGRVEILEESFESGELKFHLDDALEGRRVRIQGTDRGRPQHFRYTARLLTRALEIRVDPDLQWQDIRADSTSLATTDLVQTGHDEIRAQLARLLETPTLPAENPSASLRSHGISPPEVIDRTFAFCADDIAPADFSGHTDALTALRLGESSCGGKSRLLAALLRTAGIPTRLVGGVILTGGPAKRTSHVWVECRLGDQWVPYDPLNGHRASLPRNYVRLYETDASLIRHSRGLAFDYGFASFEEATPAVWQAADGWTQRIPLLRREGFSILLLAPFALLLTVVLRQVVGINSIGTFLPVLLGFSFLQTGWSLGVVQIGVALLLGILSRAQLGRLSMLQVPRTSVMITLLVIVFLATSAIVERVFDSMSSTQLLLPLAALAMTIERISATAADRGGREATWLLFQTIVLALLCCWILSSTFLRTLTLVAPEILLVVVAEIILVGSYRGLRVAERLRFRTLLGPGEAS